MGSRLGRYDVIRTLAHGELTSLLLGRASGMEGFQRHVAIKQLKEEPARNKEYLQAFVNEARLAAALHHHNIVQVLDIGDDGGAPFFAMEYVHGVDLRRLLGQMVKRGEQVPIQHVVSIISAAAAALHHAHEQRAPDGKPLGIVHRQVTPSNILVGYDGNVKLVDFGTAKAAIERIDTGAGAPRGSAPYMAPEQCDGRPVDRRSDVFALGIVLFELATVRRLFKGSTDFLTMAAVVSTKVPRPSQFRRDIPASLEAVMLKALARDPGARYATAGDMAEALEGVTRTLGVATSTTQLANYMKLQFGEPKEPWLEASEEERTAVDFDGPGSGLAPPPVEAVKSLSIPRAVKATASSPIQRARSALQETAPPDQAPAPAGEAATAAGPVMPAASPTTRGPNADPAASGKLSPGAFMKPAAATAPAAAKTAAAAAPAAARLPAAMPSAARFSAAGTAAAKSPVADTAAATSPAAGTAAAKFPAAGTAATKSPPAHADTERAVAIAGDAASSPESAFSISTDVDEPTVTSDVPSSDAVGEPAAMAAGEVNPSAAGELAPGATGDQPPGAADELAPGAAGSPAVAAATADALPDSTPADANHADDAGDASSVPSRDLAGGQVESDATGSPGRNGDATALVEPLQMVLARAQTKAASRRDPRRLLAVSGAVGVVVVAAIALWPGGELATVRPSPAAPTTPTNTVARVPEPAAPSPSPPERSAMDMTARDYEAARNGAANAAAATVDAATAADSDASAEAATPPDVAAPSDVGSGAPERVAAEPASPTGSGPESGAGVEDRGSAAEGEPPTPAAPATTKTATTRADATARAADRPEPKPTRRTVAKPKTKPKPKRPTATTKKPSTKKRPPNWNPDDLFLGD